MLYFRVWKSHIVNCSKNYCFVLFWNVHPKSCHGHAAAQDLLNPIHPHLFLPFVSAFKFNHPVSSLYPEVALLLVMFLVLSKPCWYVTTDSRDHTWALIKHQFRWKCKGSHTQFDTRVSICLCLHSFFFVNVPAICLLFILAITCYQDSYSHFCYDDIGKTWNNNLVGVHM